MLDLNINDSNSTDSTQNQNHNSPMISKNFPQTVDESGTSNSSIVNAEGDEDSCSTRDFTLSFDILKMEGSSSNDVVTKEFFPVKLQATSSSSFSMKNGSVDLSFNQNEEMKIVQAPQQVKKSRRGPRSRSSQYRGVTFYRRTGRWESHIWFVNFVVV